MKLRGKVAIVTGSASDIGMGFGMALAFANEGADVVLADIQFERVKERAAEIEKTGRKSLALNVDVSKEADVREMVRATVEKFGRLDILVNNAGTLIQKPSWEMTVEEFDHVVNVNLRGCFLGAKYAVPEMFKQGKGRIINTSSVAADRVSADNLCSYNASKAGVVGLTKSLAYELGPRNITVNSIAPGVIETEMTIGFRSDPNLMEQGNFLMSRCRVGRFGTARDIANAALFLASDESEFITGQTIFVDGGWVTF